MKSVKIKLADDYSLLSDNPIQSPEDAIEFIKKEIGSYDKEVFAVLNLDTTHHPINFSVVHTGTIDKVHISSRDIVKVSLLSNANKVMLFHNRPSGNCSPSENDIHTTRALQKAFDYFQIDVLDHIICTYDERYYSFEENFMLRVTDNLDAEYIDELEEDGPDKNTYTLDM